MLGRCGARRVSGAGGDDGGRVGKRERRNRSSCSFGVPVNRKLAVNDDDQTLFEAVRTDESQAPKFPTLTRCTFLTRCFGCD